MHLVVDAGNEINGIGNGATSAVAIGESQYDIDLDRVAAAVSQRSEQSIGQVRIEYIDRTPTEIANQQLVGELTKGARRYIEAPGRVE